MRHAIEIAALLLFASCVSPEPRSGIVTASLVHPDGTAPRPNVPRGDWAGDPHPKNADGTLKHDWMRGGDGDWRCFFCDVVKR